MNQDKGIFEAVPEPGTAIRPKRFYMAQEQRRRARLSVREKTRTTCLTSVESDAHQVTPEGWPTLEIGETVQIKGVYFVVTRLKPGSGNLGLKMLTTAQVELLQADERRATLVGPKV